MLRRTTLLPLFTTFIFWSCSSLDGVVSDPQTNHLCHACLKSNGDEIDTKSFNDSLSATFRDLTYQVVNQSKFFATAQQTDGSLPVYAIFQCRSYLSAPDCAACFTHAASQIRNCSAGTNLARVIYDGCFLRYESTNILEQTAGIYNGAPCGNHSAEAATAFSSAAQKLLTNLQTTTPRINGFSAATEIQVPNNNSNNGETIYGYAQCTETISQSGCEDCLKQGVNSLQPCLPNTEGRVFDAGCFMRYSTTSFFPDNQIINITSPSVKQGASSKKGLIIGVIVGGVVFVLILLTLLAYIKRPKRHKRVAAGDITGASNLKGPVTFNYGHLKYATKNFSVENKIGEGGFGIVFKGTLKNGKVVAVKKLALQRHSKRVEEEFESEVKLLNNVHHRNLVRLLGCCSKGDERILIYEYMENTSLDRFLFGKKKGSLNWKHRYDIIVGTARGLAYLHEEFYVRIIHRDIKTNNILLDDDLQPRISDFGLARLLPEEQSHLSTKVAGTLGYTAPEYAIHGQLSEKADIYSFGVVLLEIISGQRSNELKIDGDLEGEFLLRKAWKLYERGIHDELVDETLNPNDYDAEEVKKIIEVGFLCTQAPAELRPPMSEVVVLLQNKGLSKNTKPTMPILIEVN
ncbi:hypothetical protein QN277_015998 [Acacia crassicarpa]|uniref:Cysteine-rich receptor-like protein kinase 2 n=1 Tax=Acacia crassicarpa TaxID=499986 RepID=A0AAE1JX17_9FABA|nr:hypothetical protein QN277_015998 [Acacia crassicarpa]